MTAIRLEQPGYLAIIECDAPDAPGPDEALVAVRRIGVCGTDIHAFAGKQPYFTYPRILGHELGVEVLAAGAAVTNVAPGDHCAIEPYIHCGHCIACRRGRTNCCIAMQVLGVHVDGGMREQFIVPARMLHKSATLAPDQLALVEMLAIGCHAVTRASIESGEHALVIGAGPIGLSVIQFAIEAGATATVLDINADRLVFCRRHLKPAYLIDASNQDPLKRLREITNGDLPTVVFDATGSPASMMASFNYTAQGARLVFVGLVQADLTFHDPEFHRRELTLMASRNALPADFTHIIQLMEAGRLNTHTWITHRAPLASVPDEFPAWTRPGTGVIKAMIEVSP